jgi:hypothetical protein
MAVAIAIVVVVGAVEFPRAEEPGRAERDGISLELDGARLDGAGDWSVAADAASVGYVRGGVLIRAVAPKTTDEFVSRDLAVFPHTCYAVRVEGQQRRSGTLVRVTRSELDDQLSPAVPFARVNGKNGLVFSSAGERRVIVAFSAKAGAAVILNRVRLIRLPGKRACD